MNSLRIWSGQPITDDTFLMLLSAPHENVDFILPNQAVQRWSAVPDTPDERGFPDPQPEPAAWEKLSLSGRSFHLLKPIM